ncbi:MAG: hypothetical protein K8T91_23645 [Planctomycetes bacterium]|nr:hypothetical protein [Planctomycetota bacterium]
MVRAGVTALSLIAVAGLACQSAAAEPARQTVFPGEAVHAAAFQKAKAEGRLLLNVCSGAGDKKMKLFLNRLKTDPKLKRLADQYVVVFVDADMQTPTVNRYNQTAKVQGDPPWVFIVLPVGGGKVISGAANIADSDKIPEFLLGGLAQVGMLVPPKEAAKYAAALTKAKEMQAEDNPAQVLTLLLPAMRVRGFSDSVAESRELWQAIAKKGQDELSQCEKLAADSSQVFPAALQVTEIKRKYAKIPEQKKAADLLAAKIGKLDEGQTMLAEAQEISKARGVAKSPKPEGAAAIYQRLIKKYPGTAAADLATNELEGLADKPAAPAKDAAAGMKK